MTCPRIWIGYEKAKIQSRLAKTRQVDGDIVGAAPSTWHIAARLEPELVVGASRDGADDKVLGVADAEGITRHVPVGRRSGGTEREWLVRRADRRVNVEVELALVCHDESDGRSIDEVARGGFWAEQGLAIDELEVEVVDWRYDGSYLLSVRWVGRLSTSDGGGGGSTCGGG